MPSPVDCTMYPSYRRTASIISLSAGSIIARASSGSRSCSSSVEPLMSANSAVTVLRSPSRFSEAGASLTRIGESLDFFASAAAGVVNGAPQSSQNFAVGALSAPHFAQRLANGVPHSGQNFLPEVLSVPHFVQRIENPTFSATKYRHCPRQLTEPDTAPSVEQCDRGVCTDNAD